MVVFRRVPYLFCVLCAENHSKHFAISFGKRSEEPELMRLSPTKDDPDRQLVVMKPDQMNAWMTQHHREGPRCAYTVRKTAASSPFCCSGRDAKALTEIFSRTYWSPAPRKLVDEALDHLACPDCVKMPVMLKPKQIRWQPIIATRCVGSAVGAALTSRVRACAVQRFPAH